jgi:PBP1b-binding outer membrane lipoprotein LpoB
MHGRGRICALLLALALLASGCVSRTTTRQKKLSEMEPGRADGQVVTRELIWIWQPKFWEP